MTRALTWRWLLAAAASCVGLITAAPAEAHPKAKAAFNVQGQPWPGGAVARITYFNATNVKWPVKQAAKAWNSSGANVRFVAASRLRAKLIIVDQPGPRSDSMLSGTGTLGYVKPGQLSIVFGPDGRPRFRKFARPNRVTLSRLRHPKRPNYNMAGVAAHEFGHVLGLDHEDGECATMNSTLWSGCGNARPCRLLERDDIQGAIRLYGGRVRMPTPSFCPTPPTNVKPVGDPREYEVTLEWRNPSGGLFRRTAVARGKGKCPRMPAQFGGFDISGNRPGKTVTLRDDMKTASGVRTGRYCYGLWGQTADGALSHRKKVWVDFDPPRPGAPAQLQAVLGAGGQVTLSWVVEPHPELQTVQGSLAISECANDPDNGMDFFGGDDGTDTVFLEEPGRWCFAAWSVDSVGRLAGPAMTFLDYVGQPPTAQFETSPDFDDPLTIYFSNYSYDDDSEIAGYQWEFGDGATSTESDPAHTYAAAGTYTVRLTATDAYGLSDTVAQQVTVGG